MQRGTIRLLHCSITLFAGIGCTYSVVHPHLHSTVTWMIESRVYQVKGLLA